MTSRRGEALCTRRHADHSSRLSDSYAAAPAPTLTPRVSPAVIAPLAAGLYACFLAAGRLLQEFRQRGADRLLQPHRALLQRRHRVRPREVRDLGNQQVAVLVATSMRGPLVASEWRSSYGRGPGVCLPPLARPRPHPAFQWAARMQRWKIAIARHRGLERSRHHHAQLRRRKSLAQRGGPVARNLLPENCELLRIEAARPNRCLGGKASPL